MLTDETEIMVLDDRLIGGDYHVVLHEFGRGHRAILPIVNARGEYTRLHMILELFLPIGHHREWND